MRPPHDGLCSCELHITLKLDRLRKRLLLATIIIIVILGLCTCSIQNEMGWWKSERKSRRDQWGLCSDWLLKSNSAGGGHAYHNYVSQPRARTLPQHKSISAKAHNYVTQTRARTLPKPQIGLLQLCKSDTRPNEAEYSDFTLSMRGASQLSVISTRSLLMFHKKTPKVKRWGFLEDDTGKTYYYHSGNNDLENFAWGI